MPENAGHSKAGSFFACGSGEILRGRDEGEQREREALGTCARFSLRLRRRVAAGLAAPTRQRTKGLRHTFICLMPDCALGAGFRPGTGERSLTLLTDDSLCPSYTLRLDDRG